MTHYDHKSGEWKNTGSSSDDPQPEQQSSDNQQSQQQEEDQQQQQSSDNQQQPQHPNVNTDVLDQGVDAAMSEIQQSMDLGVEQARELLKHEKSNQDRDNLADFLRGIVESQSQEQDQN